MIKRKKWREEINEKQIIEKKRRLKIKENHKKINRKENKNEKVFFFQKDDEKNIRK